MNTNGNNSGMFAPERWDQIRVLLDSDGRATVDDLALRFRVSRSTIRRDLVEMDRQKLLVRTRGGAVKSQMVAFDRSVAESETLRVEAKQAIGKLAAGLISAGETVMVDAGATATQVVRHLQARGVTVVTNSFDAAAALMANGGVEVLMLGGLVRKYGGSTYGPTAEEQIHGLKADTAILGMNGVSLSEGLSTPSILVAQVKRAMIAASRRLIVVADSSKLGVAALCKVAPLRQMEIFVTDTEADDEHVGAMEELGVEVLKARP